MSATLDILNSLRDKLFDEVPDYKIELFPNNPESYNFNAPEGAILIQYAGGSFEPTSSVDVVQQKRTINVVLTILSRSQHDDNGALSVLDQARLAVQGFKPTNCEQCQIVSEAFDGEFEGVWTYQLVIKTVTWQVQKIEQKELPNFKELNAQWSEDHN